MKVRALAVAFIALASTVHPTNAAQDKAFYLARCTDQVSQKYGSGLDVKLVSLRRAGDGMRVKVAVRQESTAVGMEKVQFMTCLVSRDMTQRGSDAEEVNTPALTDKAAVGSGP